LKTLKLETIDSVIETLCSLPNNYIYRGHASATWRLESTLERLIGEQWSKESADKFEQYSLQTFQSKYHLYDHENIEPESKLAWLSLMQHYGVPTRLLDFTLSPFVALYFAIEAYDHRGGDDLAIFSIDYSSFMERSVNYIREKDNSFIETRESVATRQDEVFTEIVDRFSYDIAWVTEPRQLNVRLDRQSGCFLLSGNRGIKIEELLNSPVYCDCDFTKYTVSGSLYEQLFALLRKMNITSKSIYGDLQGLAKSLRMEMSIYSA
jgi:hypothetical protein